MDKIVKTVLKNVQFSEEWRDELAVFLSYCDEFINEFGGDVLLAEKHSIFYDISDLEYDDDRNCLGMNYDIMGYERVKDIIISCTRDDSVRKSLFLFYLLYASEYYAPGVGTNFYMKYGKEIASAEQERARCERNSDKWNEIYIRFNATKANDNSELYANDDADESLSWNEETRRGRSTNPVDEIIIRWHKGSSTYNFDSHKLNYARSSMGSSSTPYHETFKALYNSDADVRLASGELFEELKRICLWSLYVDRDNEGFGSFGEKGKTIIKKVATAAFPLYKFLVSNSDKLNTRYSYDKIITQLLGLDAPDFGEISKYLGKGFSESDKVSTHWR